MVNVVDITSPSFGASATPGFDNWDAMMDSIATLQPGDNWYIPKGDYEVSKPIVYNKGFTKIICDGRIVASDDFIGDWLFDVQNGGDTDKYNNPIKIIELSLLCNYKCRGLRRYRLDHSNTFGVRVEKPYGHGFYEDRIRETTNYSPLVLNGIDRLAYATEDLLTWNEDDTFTVGVKVRVDPQEYSPSESCGLAVVRKASDGKNYISLAKNNAGNDPANNANPLKWHVYPYQDYECVIENTGKDPRTYNTNNATPANRCWKKIYQFEFAMGVNDDTQVVSGDRSNQVTFVSPIVRECNHRIMFLADCQRFDSSLTHINIIDGHFHYLQPEVSGTIDPDLVTLDEAIGVYIGRVQNFNAKDMNIRMTNSNDAIAILIGDTGLKAATSVRFDNSCPISGEGNRQLGICVSESVVAGGGTSSNNSSISLTGTDSFDILDKTGFFDYHFKAQIKGYIHSTLDAAPVAIDYQFTNNYGEVVAFEYSVDDETKTFPFIKAKYSPSTGISRLQMSNGTSNSMAEIKWIADKMLGMGSGHSLYVDGKWDKGMLCMAGYYFWVDFTSATRKVRAKLGKPTSMTDGTVVFEL